MLRLCFGLVLDFVVAAVQAAQLDGDYFEPKINLLAMQLSGTAYSPSYQIGTSVVFTRPQNSMPIGTETSITLQLPAIDRPQQETVRTANPTWQQTDNGNRISLSHLFRMSFKDDTVNVVFRPHYLLIDGTHFRLAFRPNLALIEGARFKIIIQPQSTFIFWRKAF